MLKKDHNDELTEEDLTLGGASTLGDDNDPANDDYDDDNDDNSLIHDQSTTQQDFFVTKKGLIQLKDELKTIETKSLPRVISQLQEAIALGDLSENAEYDNSKNEQALLIKRKAELQNMIRSAKIISDKRKHSDTVKLGSTVKVKNLTDNDDPIELMLVGSIETNPLENQISNECPLGAAISDRMVGEEVKITAPSGEFVYKILAIQ